MWEAHWEVWAALTSRFSFARRGGAKTARKVLSALGGSEIVHGHSIIGVLTRTPSSAAKGPLLYVDGLVLAIDGGRYEGGPLLVVPLGE